MRDILVIASAKDQASMNIKERLLEMGDFERVGTFEGFPVMEGHGGHLVTIKDESILRNNVDAEVYSAMGVRHEGVIYLSRHSAGSGIPSLTVHPLGNFSHAKYGGYFRQLVHCYPDAMTTALRRMRVLAEEAELPHAVSFEATHHGPYLNSPTFFIEIGSGPDQWGEREPAEVLARTVLELEPRCEGPVLIGVGGGHYAPRHTDVALKKAVSYAHILPSYAIPSIGERLLEEMLDFSCEARHVYFHRKAMRKADVSRISSFFEARGLTTVREADLPDLPSEERPG